MTYAQLQRALTEIVAGHASALRTGRLMHLRGAGFVDLDGGVDGARWTLTERGRRVLASRTRLQKPKRRVRVA